MRWHIPEQLFLCFGQLCKKKCSEREDGAERTGCILRTFCIHWEVDFYDLAVKAKDDSKVGLYDVAGEIGDHDDLGFRLGVGRFVHVDVHLALRRA